MDRDDDGSEGRDLIRRNKVELCENTIVSTVLLDHLMQEDIISRIDAQDIVIGHVHNSYLFCVNFSNDFFDAEKRNPTV